MLIILRLCSKHAQFKFGVQFPLKCSSWMLDVWAKNIIKVVLFISVCWIILLYEVCWRGHNWVSFSHRPQCTFTMELKLRYLKNLKLFSTGIYLIKPILLRKKGKGFLLFLKTFSWETNLLVTLGDFTVKHTKSI